MTKMMIFRSVAPITVICAIQNSQVAAFSLTPNVSTSKAFVFRPYFHQNKNSVFKSQYHHSHIRLGESSQDREDNEIELLRAKAAKLRAEAAALEAEKAQELADAAEKAFRSFDTNKDGEISVAELKAGLEKVLKTELSNKRVEQLMKEFDDSGDGSLQLDEFVGVDKFRNKLELLSQEEKRLAVEAKRRAVAEEELAKLAQARLDILNDKDPTNTDKILSILPYLFPLMDGLQYGRFLLSSEGAESNPFVILLAVIYGLYRSIPFSGFIAFFVLNFLGGNPGINRLIRYNMQQAIFLDIALFFPGLLSGLIGLLAGGANVKLPDIVVQASTDAIFFTLVAAIFYSTASSLLGIEPNKIPLISKAVDDRMPSIDMFDITPEGRIVPRVRDDDKKDEEKDK